MQLLENSGLGCEKHQKQAELTAGRDFEATKKIFDKYKPTHVIHCTSAFALWKSGEDEAGGRSMGMK